MEILYDRQIHRVDTIHHYMFNDDGTQKRTEEEVIEQINKANTNQVAVEGKPHYDIIEIPDDSELVEVFKFLLGDSEYKILYNVTKLVERLDDMKDSLERISNNVYDLCEPLDEISEQAKKILKAE